MLYIFKFILNAILFIPRLIISAIGSFFKLLIVSIIIIAVAIYYGNHTIMNFFSPKPHSTESKQE